MQERFRIAVIGIGGVGGYYGGKLAQKYADSQDFEVIFIARGEHKQKIQSNGLILDYGDSQETVKPTTVIDDISSLGKVNLILFCVKSYSIEQVANEIKNSIDENTFLLPIQNGLDSIEYLEKTFTKAKLLWGCTYIISQVWEPGTIKVIGKYNRLVWGNPTIPGNELEFIKKIFDDAGVNNELCEDIADKVWEKFSFISPVGSLTSLTNQDVKHIVGDSDLKEKLGELMLELKALATAKGIKLPEDMVEKNFKITELVHAGTTSSMERDFSSNRPTELETLTGYVVREAEKFGVEVPLYKEVYEGLKKKRHS